MFMSKEGREWPQSSPEAVNAEVEAWPTVQTSLSFQGKGSPH